MRKPMQKISPFLWFDHQAEDAVNFYVSIFKNSKIGSVTRYAEEAAKASGRPKGIGDDGGIRAQWAGICRVERRADLQIYRGDLLCRELRDAGGSRPLLREALRRRPGSPRRVAQRQIRCVVASRSHCLG